MNHRWLFEGKSVLVGVSGGIAAYKTAELVRLFVKAGAQVRVVMTETATRFVGPVTFEALTGQAVLVDVAARPSTTGGIGHIELAKKADLMVVAPATANTMAKLAGGFASDMLSAVALASRCPLLLAPGMNVDMWNHRATQANLALLRERGCLVVGPEAGDLACGVRGMGRMSEPAAIFDASVRALSPQDLGGLKVLVTAGATRETIDDVRFLTNRSTGKMGFAMARAAAARGADVILVAGPGCLVPPYGLHLVSVRDARQMAQEVLGRASEMDVVVKSAAVADWRPKDSVKGKIAKEDLGDEYVLKLVRNPDILKELGERRMAGVRPLLVGFAAEAGAGARQRAQAKLERKNCDFFVLNDVTEPHAGFEVDTNRAELLARSGEHWAFDLMTKNQLAHEIWHRLAKLELHGEA
ncbi:MAG: bifunctional phosphopantothenoylcysteine decarboxylase/phosphopantothenate--cysteine ligase CoaBC [Deltaproteobacteria bacterium]|nr:bifunctional phosphopantothenoylcysteine decarboxylase/phosphopantothenate--cysteine ligase CoaBC [Deltaproteobacteria bacterium]